MTAVNQKDSLYQPEGKVSVRLILPYSLQQVMAMFVTSVTPITIVTSAAVPFLPHETVLNLIQASLIAVGFTTSTEIGIWDNFPTSIQTIFSQNVVAVVFVTATLLNLFLPKNMD